MEKAIKKKTVIFSIGITILFLMVSLTSVVGFQAVNTSLKNSSSPLFHLRLEKITNQGNTPALTPMYIGKDKTIQIPLPTREVLTEEILNQLSTEEIREKVRFINSDLVEKWGRILTIARNNLAEINSIIRQDYMEFQTLVTEYYAMSTQDAQERFLEQICELSLSEPNVENINQLSYETRGNITSGLLCNITSGQFCQITTQPICKITTQPICSITKGFMCWTIIGPICLTAGIKCHPPTSRPTLCSIFAAAGKILKTIIIVLLLATVVFVPLVILSLVLITVFNPERCDQIHERITTWFNCTTPERQ
jgi:hypothetical protein